MRGATRATPFGLLAASGLATSGERCDLVLRALAPAGAETPPAPGTVVANDLVLARGERLRVYDDARVERRIAGSSPAWVYDAVSLRDAPVVRRVRELAREPLAHGALVGAVARELEADGEAAYRAVERLLSAGVLVRARTSPYATAGAPLPSELRARFEGGPGAPVTRAAAQLAELMLRFPARRSLASYRDRFVLRYEGRERLVPLLELVDPELGLGPPEEAALAPPADPLRAARLAALVQRAAARPAAEVVLDAREVDALMPRDGDPAHRPASFDLIVQLAARDGSAVDEGRFLLRASPGGGTNRDGSLAQRTRTAPPHDDEAGALAAEIAYAGRDAQTARLLARPPSTSVVIADAATVLPTGLTRISPADLAVTLDGDRFAVVDARSGAEVRPVEGSSVETPYFGPPWARLLALVARERRGAPRAFDWGAFADAPVLPRLRHERLVLDVARWNVPREQLLGGAAEVHATIARLRADAALPRWIALAERDQRLLLDLDAGFASALLADQVRPSHEPFVRLEEAFPAPHEQWLIGPDGRHAAELLFSFRTDVPALPAVRRAPAAPRAVFAPGGAWTYAKLYCGPSDADLIVREHLLPLIEQLRATAPVDRWFFLRYADPEHHLRVRLHAGGEGSLLGAAASALARLVERGIVRRVAFDTYEPETERYGPGAVPLVEALYALHSERLARAFATVPASPHERLALTARTALPFVAAWFAHFDPAPWLAATQAERVKLDRTLRGELGRAYAAGPAADDERGLVEALARCEPADPLALFHTVLHLHANRAGLPAAAEGPLLAHLRAAVYGTGARGYSSSVVTSPSS